MSKAAATNRDVVVPKLVEGEHEAPVPKSLAYAIDIVQLSKFFQRQTLSRKGYSTLKSAILSLCCFQQSKGQEGAVTKAISGLTMRIPQGASVGVIGKNGSGKSTLLKLITGIYKPDEGKVSVNGRVAALIELGAGFHPDFSGRENVYLAGVMQGLKKKEIDRRFDDIVRFAELEHVIDDPLRTYSSGMFMRLGFSLAIHTDPDVLLIDEVLAVGDASFVGRCKEKISELRQQGKTLMLVSHDLDAVERWCDEAIWMVEGRVRERGEPRRVIDAYRQYIEKGDEEELGREQAERQEEETEETATHHEEKFMQPERWGSREIEITRVALLDAAGQEHLVFHPDDALTLEIAYLAREPQEDVVFGVGIHRNDGLVVHGSNTHLEQIKMPKLQGKGVLRYNISRLGLLAGNYRLDVAVHRVDGYAFDYHKAALQFGVRSALAHVGVLVPPHEWELREEGKSSQILRGAA